MNPPTRRNTPKSLLAAMAVACIADCRPSPQGPSSWAVFYGPSASVAALQRPDVLVLEPDHSWRVRAFRRSGQRVLAYVGFGEVHRSRPYFAQLEAAHALLASNPNWPDAVTVDPRSEAWRQLLLDTIVPQILEQGYDGLFLDSLDAVIAAQARGASGASQAMIDLVREIHARYPETMLVINGGLSLGLALAPSLSGFASESVFTDYQFHPPRYGVRDPHAVNERRAALAELSRHVRLPIFVLEYVDPHERELGAVIARRARDAGFIPFVTDIALMSPPR